MATVHSDPVYLNTNVKELKKLLQAEKKWQTSCRVTRAVCPLPVKLPP
jgi:hypothetical protein